MLQKTVTDVRGYQTGPIDAKGAFTSESDLPLGIKAGELNTRAEVDRPHLVDQPGMRHQYLPLHHDPATGARSSGGSYLFRRYEDATQYRDFLEAKVLPGEQTTFWKRPHFSNAVRFAWRVAGAHDLEPITTHDLIRFERYRVPNARFEAHLPELFPALLEAARLLDLAHVSLMFQPEHHLVGVITTAERESHHGTVLPLLSSVSEAHLTELGARKIFDRTGLNLAIWLPLSEQAGGAPAIWPNSPPPGIERLEKPRLRCRWQLEQTYRAS